MGPESLSALLGALYRRRLTVLLVLAGSLGAGWLYMAKTPQIYKAEAKLFVPSEAPRLSLASETANVPGGPIVPTFSEDVRIGIMGLMNSGAVFERIAERIPEVNPANLRKNLVGDVDASQQMVIAVYDPDPEFAARVANEAIRAFSDLMNEMAERAPLNTLEVLRQEIPRARKRLAAAEAARAAWLQEIGAPDLDAEQSLLLDARTRIQDQLLQLEQEEASSAEKRAELERQLAERPELERRSETLQRNEAYEKALQQVTQVQTELAELRIKYTDEHPQVKARLAELAVAEDLVRTEAEQEMLHASTQLAPDQLAQSITQQLVDVELSARTVAPRRQVLEARLAEIEARLAEIPGWRQRQEELELDIQEARDYLDRVTQREEELALTLERGLEFTYFDDSRLATADKAKPVPTLAGVLLFCGVLGLAAGFSLAVGMELLAAMRRNRPW